MSASVTWAPGSACWASCCWRGSRNCTSPTLISTVPKKQGQLCRQIDHSPCARTQRWHKAVFSCQLLQAGAETAGLTGIILTKLDGTAKGGIVIAIARELGVPVKFVGVGEGIDDLKPFDPEEFVNDLF